MSHYCVLVIGAAPENQLAPYDENLEVEFEDRTEQLQSEYENDGAKHVKFADGRMVNIHSQEIRDLWQPVNKNDLLSKCELVLPKGAKIEMVPFKHAYKDFETFVQQYHGLEKNEQGRYGYMYNPNAKWDWYELGGRWAGAVPLKTGGGANKSNFGNVDIQKLSTPFVVLKNGVWHEKGQMGWWGITKNEKSDDAWDKEVKTLIADIAPDTPIYIYDCHI